MNRMRLLLGLLVLAGLLVSGEVSVWLEPLWYRQAHWYRQAQSPSETKLAQQTSQRYPHDTKSGIQCRGVRSDAVLAEFVARRRPDSSWESPSSHDPLVPPLALLADVDKFAHAEFAHDKIEHAQFAHDSGATFEPHGGEVCASGCALSHHATDRLSQLRFLQLMDDYGSEPLHEGAQALETLLFYGPQTDKLLERDRSRLDDRHALFLRRQLQWTHARVSLRLVDEHGALRASVEPTNVPLDRRHIFEMRTNNMPAQVMSGTVKRVGLNHLWTRF